MTIALSLYLDALRFGAAFTVFLSHYAVGRFSGGLFWQLTQFGRTAVIAFFVLSGFVIAWISQTREQRLGEYALSRAARLYSVIIPAFVLTAVLDRVGFAIDPRMYVSEWGLGAGQLLLRYAASTVFLGESWTLAIQPGSDMPFWSLNYEAWYYVLFAAAAFLRGRLRIAVLLAAALLAGPKILLLFPVWLMGVAAWRWRARLPAELGAPVGLTAVAAFVVLEGLGGQQLFWQAHTPWLQSEYSAYDYVLGAIVACFIVGLANTRLAMPPPAAVRLIRWLAGTTFGLYLMHYPLLNFFAAVVPGATDAALHQVLVFGLSLGGSLTVARLAEQRKGVLKRLLRSGLAAAGGRSHSTIPQPAEAAHPAAAIPDKIG